GMLAGSTAPSNVNAITPFTKTSAGQTGGVTGAPPAQLQGAMPAPSASIRSSVGVPELLPPPPPPQPEQKRTPLAASARTVAFQRIVDLQSRTDRMQRGCRPPCDSLLRQRST